ncbi:MAG TPA: cyclopropane-fatty-acyl-phospholipid synthase family protein [Myxococcales bacterium]|nr:cyclopropane-fatty-acyl-phospholipid synthase family protein [Myxococcales bacterium]
MVEQIRDWVEFKDPTLREKYEGRPIPMNLFFESYIDGKIDIHCDLHELMRKRDLFVNYQLTWNQVAFLLGKFIPSLLIHSKGVDKKFVCEHYDRGNDFFEAFLAESMVYTSAFFKSQDDTLEEAQLRKIRYVGEKLQLKPGEKMLDVGCGWGTLVLESAKNFGVDATGVTLSRNQSEFAEGRIKAAGMEGKARVLTLDYRDIPKTTYDKISCLEMAEHVGMKNFQKFLRQIYSLLDDDGLFFLQIVGLRPQRLGALDWNEITSALFMSKYIFPGADASPPLSWVTGQLERANFEVHTVENINVHYGLTIHRWYQNWVKNKDKILAAYGERWFRLWYLFLGWQVLTGEEGRGGCFQIVCNKQLPKFNRYRYVGENVSLAERVADPMAAQKPKKIAVGAA